ncbi:MAG: tetratricopeptide repeat protein [Selenomonadaceae bacterium]|nr:tetratricopeptide repeat protein [Selenomonadaceae bacterium]
MASDETIKCLRGGDDCSCVLCEGTLNDGIASPALIEKYQQLLGTMDNVMIEGGELRGYWLDALLSMQAGNYERAVWNFRHYGLKCFKGFIYKQLPSLYYYQGLISYGIKDYALAQQSFESYVNHHVYQWNEIAYLHLGNTYFRQQYWDKALEAYGKALELRQDFPEVLINIGLVAKVLGDDDTAQEMAKTSQLFHGIFTRGTLCESPLEYTLAIPDDLSIWDIPIFINVRDRLGTLRDLVDWLLRAGYRRLYLLDNASTYPPLLSYYQELEKSQSAVQVIRLGQNIGHTAIWDSGVLAALQIDTPYVYTDPDLIPEKECPDNILEDLLGILRKYPFLKKVGLGLRTDDITFFQAESARAYESAFYTQPMETDLYFSMVDTTFALYRNYWHYDVFSSARTTGKRMMRHLPWYYDYDNLPEDEQYYMEHAEKSASWALRIREGRNSW